MQPVEEQGYLILAVNSTKINYIDCAVRLAQSIKFWNKDAKICLVTDTEYNNSVFDYVRLLPELESNPYAYESYLFQLSPFRETIKLEADMLIASNIDHWWDLFRKRDVVISTGCNNFYNEPSNNRYYRKIFDENSLPDVYNAITYWRRSTTANDFFKVLKLIFKHWDDYRQLIKFSEDVASTDVAYAMAAQIIGPELCTMPYVSYPKITHMKKHIIDTSSEDWTRELVWEYNPLRINTVAQFGAFHYHVKDWK